MARKLKTVGRWTLLRNKNDYDVWHRDRSAYCGCEPPVYPVFAQEAFMADESTEYWYLDADALYQMAGILTAEKRKESTNG